ncbi:MAG: hypothetical protein IKI76_11060 [Selenomonadaceae bacterium]|nr:hypothetical protein [Selenomonadaceae bacterium]
MTDYGITNIPDEDTFYIRQPHCAVSVRLKKKLVERVVYDTLWLVRQKFCPRCRQLRKAEQSRQSYKRRKGHIFKSKPKPIKPKPEPLPEFNTCDICGKKFKPSYPREHFCSDDCRFNSPLAKAFFGDNVDLYR